MQSGVGWQRWLVGRRVRRRRHPDDDTPGPAYGGSVPDARPRRRALTIAGSDSGGGAGAQADLKTFAALRVHGTCALTAVTAQNTAEVRGVVALEPAFVRQQVEAVLDDFDVRSVKTGMLATAPIVAEVAAPGRRGPAPPASSSTPCSSRRRGTGSWSPRGSRRISSCWSPTRSSLTPNLREAAILSAAPTSTRSPTSPRGAAVAEQLRARGARYVVVKGGHLSDSAEDVVAGPDGVAVLPGSGWPPATTMAPGARSRPPSRRTWPVERRRTDAIAERQGLRRPGAGRRRRLAPRGGARPPRPFRVVGPAVGWHAA